MLVQEHRHTAPVEAVSSALQPAAAHADLERRDDGELRVRLSGHWKLGQPRPLARELAQALAETPRRVVLVAEADLIWDTALLIWLRGATTACTQAGIEVDRSLLPRGIVELLRISEIVDELPRRAASTEPSLLARVGRRAANMGHDVVETLGFVGRVARALVRFVSFRAQFRGSDLCGLIQTVGADAVPIVTLVSVIVGMILAFVGSVQLRLFGADLYIANMVGIGMVREVGALVVGIIMAGRTGAAFAAQLGTMKVTEELDALSTFGISTIEYLVVPRVVALSLMIPFLCLYSMTLGIFGGALVGVGLLGLSPQLYFDQTLQALTLADLYGGVFRGAVYGILIGVTGCMRGMRCGNDVAAVGEATTAAVVTAIIAIVVADGAIAVIFNALGI